MGKQSPNKRKSEAGAVTTPKKQKLDVVENVKTPLKPLAINTPKSGKKGGNKTPNAVNNNKSPNQTPGKQNNQQKTPGKQNNQVKTPGKQNNQVKTPGKQNNQVKTPGKQNNQQNSPAKQNNKQNSPAKQNNQVKTPGKQNNQVKTPGKQNNQQKTPGQQNNQPNAPGSGKKSGKKNKKNKAATPQTEGATPEASPKQLQKFAGTKDVDGAKPLSKRAQRRLKVNLKKRAIIEKNKELGIETVFKQNPNQLAKKEARKNLLMQKLSKLPGTNVNKKEKMGKKKFVPKPKAVPTPKVEAEDSEDEESDYEVESTIKPEKIAKLNASEDDDEEDDDDDEDEDDDDDESADEDIVSGKETLAKTVEVKDLLDAGIVKKGQTRYVVFAGNLPFDATKATVTAHFQKVCDVKDVRIPLDKNINKPRGFAYVEVTNVDHYNKALSLHHSFLDGRRINVLYTKVGKKNSPDTKKEIKHKNYKFNAMRQMGKLPGGKKPAQQRCVRRAKKREFDKKSTDYISN